MCARVSIYIDHSHAYVPDEALRVVNAFHRFAVWQAVRRSPFAKSMPDGSPVNLGTPRGYICSKARRKMVSTVRSSLAVRKKRETQLSFCVTTEIHHSITFLCEN